MIKAPCIYKIATAVNKIVTLQRIFIANLL